MENKNQSCLGIMVDLAGCPNRCRHCWLGEHRNGCMGAQEFIKIAIQFKRACEAVENGCRELSFFSWWREPDFHRDYRELWRLEQELSSPGAHSGLSCCQPGVLLATSAMPRWAAALPTQACQVTFFGMEQSNYRGCAGEGLSGPADCHGAPA
ncbi:MAG: radical SAM protein [Hydrogeniiclostridium mannosilyticum]